MVRYDVAWLFSHLTFNNVSTFRHIVQETDINLPGGTSFSSIVFVSDCLQGHTGPSHSSQPSSYDVMVAFSSSKVSDVDVDVIRALYRSNFVIDIVC